MIGRLLRQLTGKCHREKQAEEIMRHHEVVTEKKKQEVRENVAASEQLVRRLKKDVEAWSS